MKEMDKDVRARWEALMAATDELAASVHQDVDVVKASFNQFRQLAKGLDPQEILNSVHVPKNAGKYEDSLRKIMARIPDGWGRWISCDQGWYPILIELDEQLEKLSPDYQVHQVKEKYGSLCYYYAMNLRVTDPKDPEPEFPKAADDEATSKWQEAYDAWRKRLEAYQEGPGRERLAAAKKAQELAEKLVSSAEELAGQTCELCGKPGELSMTKGPSPWYKTLCESCRGDEYLTQEAWNSWWEVEEPKFRAREKARWAEAHQDRKLAAISTSPRELAVEASYLSDPEAARAAAYEEFYAVWIDSDEAGWAYLEALVERHQDYAKELKEEYQEWRAGKRRGGFSYRPPQGVPTLYKLNNYSREFQDRALEIGITIQWNWHTHFKDS